MRFPPHASWKAGQKGQSKISWYFKGVCLPQPTPTWRRDNKISPLVLLCKHKQWLTGCCETTGWSRCISSHTLRIRFVPSACAPLFPELKSLQLSYSQPFGALLLWGNVSKAVAVSQPMAWCTVVQRPPECPLTSLVLQSFCCLMDWASSFPYPQNTRCDQCLASQEKVLNVDYW